MILKSIFYLAPSMVPWWLRNTSTTTSVVPTWRLIWFRRVWRGWGSWIPTFSTTTSGLATASCFTISVSGISSVLCVSGLRSGGPWSGFFTRFFNWRRGTWMTSFATSLCWKKNHIKIIFGEMPTSGLISESSLLWLKSQKKGAKLLSRACSL